MTGLGGEHLVAYLTAEGGHGSGVQELGGHHDACDTSLNPVLQGFLEGLLSENSSVLPGLWDPGRRSS